MKSNTEKILDLIKNEPIDVNVKRLYDSITDNSTDVKFYVSQFYDTTSVRNSGDVSIILTDDIQPKTSIWLKDKHIASGYGFNTLADKLVVEELISNPNLKVLLQNTTVKEHESEEGDEPSTVDFESVINIDNASINLFNGILSCESFIKIYDIRLYLVEPYNGKNYIKLGEALELSIFDTLEINNIQIDYTYTSTSDKNLKYLFKVSNEELSDEFFVNERNYKNFTNIQKDGKKHTLTIPVNPTEKVKKSGEDENAFIETKYIYFSVKDLSENNVVTYKTNEVSFNYPFAKLDNYVDVNSIRFADLDCKYYLKDTQGLEFIFNEYINTDTDGQKNHYLLIPYAIKDNYQIILKQSNIAAEFNSKFSGIIDGNYYIILESPQKYVGKVSWIIKIIK